MLTFKGYAIIRTRILTFYQEFVYSIFWFNSLNQQAVFQLGFLKLQQILLYFRSEKKRKTRNWKNYVNGCYRSSAKGYYWQHLKKTKKVCWGRSTAALLKQLGKFLQFFILWVLKVLRDKFCSCLCCLYSYKTTKLLFPQKEFFLIFSITSNEISMCKPVKTGFCPAPTSSFIINCLR